MQGWLNEIGGSGPEDEIGPLVEKIKEATEKLGLYMGDVVVATPDEDVAEQITQGKSLASVIADGAHFALVTSFVIGDVAWRKRTLDPEQDAVDDQTRLILPDPADEIRKRLAEGGSLFEDDDGDDQPQ